MTFEEWWAQQPPKRVAEMYAHDARAVWEAAANAEREACAQLCDAQHFGGDHDDDLAWTGCAAVLAEEIRARSNKPS